MSDSKSYIPTYYGINPNGNHYVCFEDGDGNPGYSYINLDGSEYCQHPDGATTYRNPAGRIYSTPSASGDNAGITVDSSESAALGSGDGITDFAIGGGTTTGDSDIKK